MMAAIAGAAGREKGEGRRQQNDLKQRGFGELSATGEIGKRTQIIEASLRRNIFHIGRRRRIIQVPGVCSSADVGDIGRG